MSLNAKQREEVTKYVFLRSKLHDVFVERLANHPGHELSENQILSIVEKSRLAMAALIELEDFTTEEPMAKRKNTADASSFDMEAMLTGVAEKAATQCAESAVGLIMEVLIQNKIIFSKCGMEEQDIQNMAEGLEELVSTACMPLALAVYQKKLANNLSSLLDQ